MILKALTSLWRVQGRPKAESVSSESLGNPFKVRGDPTKSEGSTGSLSRKKVIWEKVMLQAGRVDDSVFGPRRTVLYETATGRN